MPLRVQIQEIQRRWYKDVSVRQSFTASDTTATLITGRALHTIFVQRIIVWIITDAAQSWTFEDSNSSAKQIAKVTTSPGAATRWDFDFGDDGEPLTEAKNLVLTMSAAGLAGNVIVVAYEKPTSALVANTAGATRVSL
jgi:hypothetical protein